MNDFRDDLSPRRIDQRIDHPDACLEPADARLIHEIRAMLEQEKNASLERGWSRLASLRARANQPAEALNLADFRQQNAGLERPRQGKLTEKDLLMNDTTVPSNLTRPTRPRWLRRLSLLAAALVGVALVGSLMFVLTAMHGKAPNTTVASGKMPTSTPAPTMTIPANCKDQHDLADELLCAQGTETVLNVTKTLSVHVYSPFGAANGSGTVNVTFLRAYADTTRLMLVYNIAQAPKGDWGGFQTLQTKQGQLNSNASNFSGFTVQSFDTSKLPAGTTQIQVQAISTYYGATLPLTFTVPVDTANRIIRVKQTSSSKGYSLALDHVVFTGCTAALYLNAVFPAANKQEGTSMIGVQAVTFDGQSLPLKAFDWRFTGAGNNQGVMFHLGLPLLHNHSAWTITIALVKMPASQASMKDRVLMTATFTILV